MKKIILVTSILLAILLCGCIDKDEDFVDETVKVVTDDKKTNEEDTDDVIEEQDSVPEISDPDKKTTEGPAAEEKPIDDVPDASTPSQSTVEEEKPDEETQSSHIPVQVGVTDIKLSTYDVTVTVGQKKMPIVTMYPQNATNKGEIWTSSDSGIATVDGIGNIKGVAKGNCTVTVTSVDNSSVSATVNVTVNAEAECTYIDGILIVNKTYPLPATYAPGWETEASGPLWEMIAAAKEEGIKLWMTSGYRSYYDQQYIYNGYVKRDGQEKADTYSARPGHSEHQTGLAYDLNDLHHDFGETPEGKWVAENCHKYGFILRYPKGKEEITGYIYEPWHIRYLGVEKATEVYESGLCLEEFLNITSVYADE